MDLMMQRLSVLDLFYVSAGSAIAGFAMGMWWATAMEKVKKDNKRLSDRMDLIQQRQAEKKKIKRTRTVSRMTPRLFQGLDHSGALKYLQNAGVAEDLTRSIPDHIDGFYLMECATPDRFGFSTADKLFWLQIENKEACKRIGRVLDELMEKYPNDLNEANSDSEEAHSSNTNANPNAEILDYDADTEGEGEDESKDHEDDNANTHVQFAKQRSNSTFVLTKNEFGVSYTSPTRIMLDWIQRATEQLVAPMMEIGCAYGVATLDALARGAGVFAIDIDKDHLESLADSAAKHGVPVEQLWCVQGKVPDVLDDMEDESVSHVLAANVLHFLTPKELTETLKHLHRLMSHDSYLYIEVDSPFINGLGPLYYLYILKKALGFKFPGYFWLPSFLLPPRLRGANVFHFMDVDTIVHAAREAKFHVVDAGYHPSPVETDTYKFNLDGRESCVLVARK
eukprot:m.64473 g.64473  ORF g.64473 m.64473 type:complete len:452 (+) comp11485_c1_seq1:116-1471(+)